MGKALPIIQLTVDISMSGQLAREYFSVWFAVDSNTAHQNCFFQGLISKSVYVACQPIFSLFIGDDNV